MGLFSCLAQPSSAELLLLGDTGNSGVHPEPSRLPSRLTRPSQCDQTWTNQVRLIATYIGIAPHRQVTLYQL